MASGADPLWVPGRGDMIWIDFNPSKPNEMLDVHPMLVLTSKNFNLKTSLVIGLPMTHAENNETNPFAVHYTYKGEKGYVLTHLPKSFDWRLRGAKPHPWGKVPQAIIDRAMEEFKQLLDL